MAEKFKLAWDHFESNASRSFTRLREDTDLCDVTLISDDQEQVRAHKVVLASCSEVFKSIFQKNKQNSLCILMNDMSSNELGNLLDYIYCGKVDIEQSHMERFLEFGKKFKLEGLKNEILNNVDNNSTAEQSIKEEEETENLDDQSHQSKASRPSKIKKDHPVFSNPKGPIDISKLDKQISEYIEIVGENCVCKVCGKIIKGSSRKRDMARHIEIHIEGLSFDCKLSCGKTFRSRKYFQKHLKKCKNIK